MTNEDIIDVVNRVKLGTIVVVLPPGRSAWMGLSLVPVADHGSPQVARGPLHQSDTFWKN
jgi:hypothetical protein